MKKLIALFVMIAVMTSLAVTAFAEENVGIGDYSTEVKGTYVAGTTGNGVVYSVDITWSAMEFTYHAAQEPVWDVESHTYSESVAAYWEGEGTITVTNHSNVSISATPVYTAEEGYEEASMLFDTEKLIVSSAESGAEQTGVIAVTPSGALPANADGEKIGTITVTIAGTVTLDELKALDAKLESLMDAYDEFYRGVPSYEMPEAAETLQYDMEALSTTLAGMIMTFGDGPVDEYDFRSYVECRSDYVEILAQAKKLGIVT